jgi:hypothetical protein
MKSERLPQEKWIIAGIPILFLIGAGMHFIYEFSGNNFLIGLIAPINESVWEHTKMVVLPVILWWALYYLVKGSELSLDKNKWFTGCLASLVVSILSIPFLYYFYTGAFGVEYLWADILILLIALFLGQFTGLHVYNYSKGINSSITILIIILIIFIYAFFTLHPPDYPLFISK